MKAIQLEKPESFRSIEIEEPGTPQAGHALVRIHRVGVCGTDISGYLGKMPFFSYPRVPGHELGVEILEVGTGVNHIKAGDRCSVEPYISCYKCYACKRGFTNCCENNQTLGVMCDGGLCERMILPAEKLHPSAKLTYDQLALVETLAIGCHAVNRGDPKPGQNVLIVGAGPIGLSAIEFARLSGARTVVMDINEQRLSFVREKIQVPDTILSTGEGEEVAQLARLTNGQLADVVIDATGNNKSMANAMSYCSFAGKLVYVGITQQEISFPHAPIMHRRELTIMASRNALPADFRRIIKLIEDGQINTSTWITHNARFDSMISEFPAWTRLETRVIKAMVSLTE